MQRMHWVIINDHMTFWFYDSRCGCGTTTFSFWSWPTSIVRLRNWGMLYIRWSAFFVFFFCTGRTLECREPPLDLLECFTKHICFRSRRSALCQHYMKYFQFRSNFITRNRRTRCTSIAVITCAITWCTTLICCSPRRLSLTMNWNLCT